MMINMPTVYTYAETSHFGHPVSDKSAEFNREPIMITDKELFYLKLSIKVRWGRTLPILA